MRYPSTTAHVSRASRASHASHEEWLTVPWWGWLLTLATVIAFVAPFGLAAPDGLRWAALAVPPATAAALWWLGRIRVAVVDGELIVDDARLPVRFVAGVVPLDAAGRGALLGPEADPLAFVVQRPWIPGAVQVVLDDPADPTPYWLVSTRHPERLAGALRRAGQAGPDEASSGLGRPTGRASGWPAG